MPIAKNIKYLRKQNNMTQQELAEKLGLKSHTTINKWETKVIFPPTKKVYEMADIFHCDFSDLTDIDIEKRDIAVDGEKPTPEEMQNLLKFRTLPTREKKIIRAALDTAYENIIEEIKEDAV